MSLEEAYRAHLCSICENRVGCTRKLTVNRDEQQYLNTIKCPDYVREHKEEITEESK